MSDARQKVTPFRILIFGQSNASGEYLADPRQAWPFLLGRMLEGRLGRPVEVTVRPIYVQSPGLLTYLERELERYQPDAIWFGATAFAFAQEIVAISVRRRFGKRAGDFYQRLESRFDKRTRHSDAGSRINRGARRVTAKLLGAEPISTYEVVLQGTSEVLRRLVQEEQRSVVVYNVNAFEGAKTNPATAALLDQFDNALRELATRLSVPLLDPRGEIALGGPDMLMADRLHFNAAGHVVVAETITRLFDSGSFIIEA